MIAVSTLAGLRGMWKANGHTISTVPFPDSLTVKAKGASKPDASLTVRNAWCGLLALDPSLVVRETLSLSPCPKVTADDTTSLSENWCVWEPWDDRETTSTAPSEKPQEEAALAAPAKSARVEAIGNRIV